MTRVPSPRPRSHSGDRTSCLHRLALLTTLVIPTSLVAGAYGDWVDAPGLDVPGRPVAELAVSGETFLLLETLSPESALASDAPTFGALLWNPATTLSLDPPADLTVADLVAVRGMMSSAGPRVYALGNFTLAGVATRVVVWDGVAWGLPGGAVGGVVPTTATVRETPTGPELWVGGDILIAPGVPELRTLLRHDGTTWSEVGEVLGLVEDLLAIDEGLPTGEAVYVAGTFSSVEGVPVNRLARYVGGGTSGSWDDVDGGRPGTDLRLSSVRLDPALPPALWVLWDDVDGGLRISSRSAPSTGATGWTEHATVGGVWVEERPTRAIVLPTYFGSSVFFDGRFHVVGTGPGGFSSAWRPDTAEWITVPTNVEGAYRFDSPSGLFPTALAPTGVYRYLSSTGEQQSWEVGLNEPFIRGDVNGDGLIQISDAIALLAVLFPVGPAPLIPDCDESRDANGDDGADVADAIFILGHLFPQGPGPGPTFAPPFPDCGLDLGVGSLDCNEFPLCP